MESVRLNFIMERLLDVAAHHCNVVNSLGAMKLSDPQKEDFIRRRDELQAILNAIIETELIEPRHLYRREYGTRVKNGLDEIIKKGKITKTVFKQGPNKIPI
ncbi:MAG: hypothetical protein HY226_01290 [Candidatus Vogelbacteria bacterium]|nr:hypothetical protein [Candidatus Vogelbacteria bacterium]